MELWVFDRSGIYSSDLLDMHDDFPWFLAVLLSYRLMSDSELGRSDVIQDCEAGRCITIKDAAGMPLGRSGKLYLEDRAIALASELVGEGLACYRAKSSPSSSRWEYVVKFKWRLARDRLEEEMLKWVNEKNAWGVISLDHHRKIETTANLRRGIRWGPCRRLFTGDEHQHLLPGTRKHRGIHGLTEATDETFGNRIFTCVVVSPAGRPLGTFKTILELLEVLRDAVKAHRSVLQDAGVLHQDVSPGNIIITDTQDHREPKGILIDFDVAMRLDVGPRTPGEVTGTRPFMAIGILKCRRHTYRHDLESFLYVFLWTLLANGNENPPRTSKLRLWSRGTWDESADAKVAQMDRDGFQSILTEFPPEVHSLRSLAEKLRRLLFPLEDGALWTGTDSSLEGTNALYDGIIGAFDDAIAILGTTHLEAS